MSRLTTRAGLRALRVTALIFVTAMAAGTTAAALNDELSLGDEVAIVCVSASGTVKLDRVCFPRAGQVMFVAEHGVADATPRTTEQQSAVNVPTPMDVDGNGTPDVTATFRVVDPTTFSLQVDKVLGAPDNLPLQLVAVLKDPAGSTSRYVFGYNARNRTATAEATAPARFTATLKPAVTSQGTRLDVDVAASKEGPTLELLGHVHQAGPDEAVVDPAGGKAMFTPVPAALSAELFFPAENAVPKQTKGTLKASEATKVELQASGVSGPAQTRLNATLDKLNGSVSAVLLDETVAGATAERTTVTLDTTGPRVSNANVVLTETDGGQQVTKTDVRVENLPTSSTIKIHPETATDRSRVEATLSPAADLVDVSRVEGPGEAERLSDDRFARIVTEKRDGKTALKSVAARVRGLSRADLKFGEGFIDVLMRTGGGPMHVLVTGAGPRIETTAADFAECTRFAFADHRVERECSSDAGADPHDAPSPGSSNVILLEGSTATTGAVDVNVQGLEGNRGLVASASGLPRRVEAIIRQADPTTSFKLGTVGPRIAAADLTLTEKPTTGLESKTKAHIEDLPTKTELTLDAKTATNPTRVRATMNQPADVIDASRVEGPGEAERLPDDRFARVVTETRDGQAALKSVAARLRSVSEIALEADDGLIDVLMRSAGGPLHVLVTGPGPQIEATASDLAPCTRFVYTDRRVSRQCSAGAGTDPQADPVPGSAQVMLFEGSQTSAGTIDLSVDPLEDGRRLIANVTGIPRRVEAIVNGVERLDLDTVGGSVGDARVRLTSGPTDDTLGEEHDGVLVRDKLRFESRGYYPVERKVVLARLRQVHKLRFSNTTARGLDATVDSARTGPFKVDIENDEAPDPAFVEFGGTIVDFPPVVKYLRASASDLQRNTRLTFSDATGASKIHYNADGEIGRLNLDTNVSGSLNLGATATSVARSLDLCIHPGGGSLGGDAVVCNLRDADGNAPLGVGLPNGPTILAEAAAPLNAASPMTVDFLDCKQRDSDGGCGDDKDPARFIEINDLRFRKLALQMHKGADDKQRVYLDTDRHAVRADLTMLLDRGLSGHSEGGEVAKVFGKFPQGFNAEERRVTIGKNILGFPTQDAWSGDIFCPSGTDLYVTAKFLGINAGLTGVLCDNPDDPNV